MCFYSDDYAEFQNTAIHKARKLHRCDGCGHVIHVGHLYVYQSGKFDGDFYTSHICGVCELDRHRIHIAELSEGCGQSESWCPYEDIREMLPHYGMLGSEIIDGQRWLERLIRTGQTGVGTAQGWREWMMERAATVTTQ